MHFSLLDHRYRESGWKANWPVYVLRILFYAGLPLGIGVSFWLGYQRYSYRATVYQSAAALAKATLEKGAVTRFDGLNAIVSGLANCDGGISDQNQLSAFVATLRNNYPEIVSVETRESAHGLDISSKAAYSIVSSAGPLRRTEVMPWDVDRYMASHQAAIRSPAYSPWFRTGGHLYFSLVVPLHDSGGAQTPYPTRLMVALIDPYIWLQNLSRPLAPLGFKAVATNGQERLASDPSTTSLFLASSPVQVGDTAIDLYCVTNAPRFWTFAYLYPVMLGLLLVFGFFYLAFGYLEKVHALGFEHFSAREQLVDIENRHAATLFLVASQAEAKKMAELSRIAHSIVHHVRNLMSNVVLSSNSYGMAMASAKSKEERIAIATKRSDALNEMNDYLHGLSMVLGAEISKPSFLQTNRVAMADLAKRSMKDDIANTRIREIQIVQHSRSLAPAIADHGLMTQAISTLLRRSIHGLMMTPGMADRQIRIHVEDVVGIPGVSGYCLDYSKREGTPNPDEVWCVVEIEDTGPDIPAEKIPKLFEPRLDFESAHGPSLYSVAQIMSVHAGLIRVSSGQGRTAISLYFERAQTSTKSMPGTTSPEVIASCVMLEDGLGINGTALLVEDHVNVRSLLKSILELHGLVVIEASTAEEALGLIDSGKFAFSVVLLDHYLGSGAHGLTVAERLRRLGGKVPVLHISATLPVDFVETPLDIYLAKPFTPINVVDALRRVFGIPLQMAAALKPAEPRPRAPGA